VTDVVLSDVPELEERVAAAGSLEELGAVEQELLGKRSELAKAHQRLGGLPVE
jgi:hypothetical protein